MREGDALQTLRDLAAPVDLVFLDGWKDHYLPVLDLLKPKLRKGSVILADDIDFPPMVRIPAKPITHSKMMAITNPKDADRRRSEATLGYFYHAEVIGIRQMFCA